jgi:acetyl esterase/lipase
VHAKSTGDSVLEKRVIYELPGMQEIPRRTIVYGSEGNIPLAMDIYYPPASPATSELPAVIFVMGYPNSVVLERFGMKLKDSGQYVSWGQLAAASGVIAITYETTQPEKDVYSVLAHARQNAKELRIDSNRMGLWACSGNVPAALSVLAAASTNIKCSVLYYGVMFEWDGSDEMEALATRYGSVYPCKAESVESLSPDIPLFVVRTGADNPHLNKSIEHFVCEATRRNLPLTFVNYAGGQHGFDLENDTGSSREIIRHTLAFLQEHLFKAM